MKKPHSSVLFALRLCACILTVCAVGYGLFWLALFGNFESVAGVAFMLLPLPLVGTTLAGFAYAWRDPALTPQHFLKADYFTLPAASIWGIALLLSLPQFGQGGVTSALFVIVPGILSIAVCSRSYMVWSQNRTAAVMPHQGAC